MTKTAAEVEVRRHITGLSRDLFVRSADGNYLMARTACRWGLYDQFFWNSAQAIEKYLKAILVLHDKDVKSQGHDISRLYDAASQVGYGRFLTSAIELGPSYTNRDGETGEDFVRRVGGQGAPDIRYGLLQVYWHSGDLHKLDHVVWNTRRLCRRFDLDDSVPEASVAGISREEQTRDLSSWRLGDKLLLESWVDAAPDDPRREALLWSNIAFDPSASHDMSRIFMAWMNATPSLYLAMLNSVDHNTQKLVIDVLTWFLNHVKVSSEQERLVRAALSQTKTSSSGKAR